VRTTESMSCYRWAAGWLMSMPPPRMSSALGSSHA